MIKPSRRTIENVAVALWGILLCSGLYLSLRKPIDANREETLTNRSVGREIQHAIDASNVARDRNAAYMQELIRRAGGDPDAVLAATRPAKP